MSKQKLSFFSWVLVPMLSLFVFLSFTNQAHAEDPQFDWAKQLVSQDGSSSSWPGVPKAIAKDSNGNIYVTGVFYGTVDFDPGAGTNELTSAGSGDIFILKLDSDGNYIWAKDIGGTGNDYGYSLSLDSNANVYVTGVFQDTVDFDPSTGEAFLTSNGNDDVFILKLDSDGNYVWAKDIGGTGYDDGFSLSLDSNANVYVTGQFQDIVDFDPGTGEAFLTSNGGYDIFVLKLDSDGNYVWAKDIGGTVDDWSNSLSLDSNANVYVTGQFQDIVDFDPGTGTANLTSNGSDDVFVLKLDSGGNYLWAKDIGGTGYDDGMSLSLDSNANVYVTGWFNDVVDFDPGTGEAFLTSNGSDDVFVLKLDSDGNYVWAKDIGGTGNDEGMSLSLDSNANVYVTGWFNDVVDFNPTGDSKELTAGTGGDSFILELDKDGNYVWVGQIAGGDSGNYPYSILVSDNDIYVGGEIYGVSDVDPTSGVYELTAGPGGEDGFIIKLSIPQPVIDIPTTSTSHIVSSGTSAQSRYNNLISMGKILEAQTLFFQFPKYIIPLSITISSTRTTCLQGDIYNIFTGLMCNSIDK